MKTTAKINERAGERGAITIKTAFTFVLLGIAAFLLVKIAPVYVEERGVKIEIDELARISAVRNLKKEDIQKGMDKLRSDYDLPSGSINLVSAGGDRAQISVKYTRLIDLLVYKYDWNVDYTANGRSL